MNICSFYSQHDEAEFIKGNFPSLGTQGATVGMDSIGEQQSEVRRAEGRNPR